jgi:DNA (cytosine-5)-methyltransferase 1
MADRDRNTLVGRSGDFAVALDPAFFVMENARELITGNHPQHFHRLRERLVGSGYDVRADVHFLSRFGLPQIRGRALIVASRGRPARTLEDLWEGWEIAPEAVTVRNALSRLDEWLAENPDDPDGLAVPGMREDVQARLAARQPTAAVGWMSPATQRRGTSAPPIACATGRYATSARTRMSTAACGGIGRLRPSSGSARTSGTVATRIPRRTAS